MTNPCQSQLDIVRTLENAVSASQGRVDTLQERLLSSNPAAKPAILKRIAAANEELQRAKDTLEADGPAARAEYDQCIADALAAQDLLPFSIRVNTLHCWRETSEPSASDEPYILVFVANMNPLALDIECYRFGPWEMDAGDHKSIRRWVWGTADDGITLSAAALGTFFVALTVLENDEFGSPKGMRVAVKGAGAGALAGSASLSREDSIDRLSHDIADTVDGIPFEDRIGSPKVWDITEDEVKRASLFGSVDRSFTFRGDGARYGVDLTLLSHSE